MREELYEVSLRSRQGLDHTELVGYVINFGLQPMDNGKTLREFKQGLGTNRVVCKIPFMLYKR